LDTGKNITQRWHTSEVLLCGGSAGAFKILLRFIKVLPADLNKAVVVVLHRKKNYVSDLENMFAQNSAMPVREINDKDKIRKNTIYLAPANYHTLIEKGGYFSLDVSDSLWYSKPAIDVTFESAADCYGNRCTAVLLSGANVDGAAGLLKLKLAGSLTVAQHPDDAEMPEMPQAAINLNAAEYVLTANEILDLVMS